MELGGRTEPEPTWNKGEGMKSLMEIIGKYAKHMDLGTAKVFTCIA